MFIHTLWLYMGGVERVKNITALVCKFQATVCENVFLRGSVVKCFCVQLVQ